MELSEKQSLGPRVTPATLIDINQPFAQMSMRDNPKVDLAAVFLSRCRL